MEGGGGTTAVTLAFTGDAGPLVPVAQQTCLHALMRFGWELKARGGEWGSPHAEVGDLLWTPCVSRGLRAFSFKLALV